MKDSALFPFALDIKWFNEPKWRCCEKRSEYGEIDVLRGSGTKRGKSTWEALGGCRSWFPSWLSRGTGDPQGSRAKGMEKAPLRVEVMVGGCSGPGGQKKESAPLGIPDTPPPPISKASFSLGSLRFLCKFPKILLGVKQRYFRSTIEVLERR